MIDTREGTVVSLDTLEEENFDPERYIDIPEWNSAKGFLLMERFTASLKNPVVKHELTAVLDQGKGVFRSFKNILSQYPHVETRWFTFKEREMKRTVIHWYNALRDEWGLERIGNEPEETYDLVLEDFIFRKPEEKDITSAKELHTLILEEEFDNDIDRENALKGEPAMIAETTDGDFSAYIAVTKKNKSLHISALEVKPEFRGLGLGEELCAQYLRTIDPKNVSYITIDLPATAEGFSRVLLRKQFKPHTTRYLLKLNAE